MRCVLLDALLNQLNQMLVTAGTRLANHAKMGTAALSGCREGMRYWGYRRATDDVAVARSLAVNIFGKRISAVLPKRIAVALKESTSVDKSYTRKTR